MHYLGLEVPANIISAATGGDECAAAGKSGGSDEIALGNGWTVRKSGGSVVAEHKAGTDTTTETDVTIKWPDGFRVWVNKASKEEVKSALDAALQKGGRSYVLTITIWNGAIYEVYGQDAKEKIKNLSSAVLSPATLGVYTGACVATTILCEGIKVSLGNPMGIIKAIAYEAPGCAIGAVFSGLAFRTTTSNLTQFGAGVGLGALGYLGAEYVKYYGIKTGIAGYHRLYGGLIFKGSPLSTMRKIYAVADSIRTGKSGEIGRTLGELAETLQKSPSTIPGVDYSAVKLGTLTGIPKQTAGEALKALEDARAISKILSGDELQATKKVLEIISKEGDVSKVSPEDLKKFGTALEKLHDSGFFGKNAKGAKELAQIYKDTMDNLSHPQDLVKNIGEEVGSKPSFKRSFICGALGNVVGSTASLVSVNMGLLQGYREIKLNVCDSYTGTPVQIIVNQSLGGKTQDIFAGPCRAQPPTNSNIPPSININAG